MAAPGGSARLVRALAEIPGLLRIRYTTSHPRDMDDALIAAHRDVAQLMPFLHLPVQSGSDRMLAAMNRKHTRGGLSPPDRPAARGAARISRCRRISSSAIPARPTPTTRRRSTSSAGSASPRPSSFKYSPRPGTPAAGAPAQVAEDGEGCAPAGAPGAAAREPGRLQRALRGPHPARAGHRAGPPSRPDRPDARPICSRSTSPAPQPWPAQKST